MSANNVFMYNNGVQDVNNEIDTRTNDIDGLKGGTPWASAKEEAFDERRDAEILHSVVSSIADWKERQEIRHAK